MMLAVAGDTVNGNSGGVNGKHTENLTIEAPMMRQRLAALDLARGGANGDFVTLVSGDKNEWISGNYI